MLKLLDRITGASGEVAAWLVFPLIIASCYEVVSRYVFNAPTLWAFEVGYMVMGTHFLIGIAYALREDAHVRVDFLFAQLSPRKKAAFDIVAYVLLVLPVAGWLTVALWQKVLVAYESQERSGMSAFNPLIWPYRLIMCIAFLLLVLQVIAKLIRAWRVLSGPAEAGTMPAQGHRQ